jgi:hypothetical protein
VRSDVSIAGGRDSPTFVLRARVIGLSSVCLSSVCALALGCDRRSAPPPARRGTDPAKLITVEMPRYVTAVPEGWRDRRYGDTVEARSETGEFRAVLIVAGATLDELATTQRTATERANDVVDQTRIESPPSVRIVYEGYPAVGGGGAGMPTTKRERHRSVETCLLGRGVAACFQCTAAVADFAAVCGAHDAIVARSRLRE